MQNACDLLPGLCVLPVKGALDNKCRLDELVQRSEGTQQVEVGKSTSREKYLHVEENGHQVEEEQEEEPGQGRVSVGFELVDTQRHLEKFHPELRVARSQLGEICAAAVAVT